MEFPRLPVSPHLLVCLLAVWVLAKAAEVPVVAPASGCRTNCGDIDVPYPFGLDRPDCAIHPDFLLSCTRKNGTDKLFYNDVSSNLQVIKISVPEGKVWLRNFISQQCYNPTTRDLDHTTSWMNLTGTPFILSANDNRMFGIGCRSYPFVVTDSYIVGCKSICHHDNTPIDGSCSGVGCCEAVLSKSTKTYQGRFYTDYNTSQIWKAFPCNYVTIRETVNFSFSTTSLSSPASFYMNKERGRVVADWAITQDTCQQATINQTTPYACVSNNSDCVTNDAGYRCVCSSGYEGNPYLINGCTDVNECLDNATHPCAGICTNIPGYFTCSCPPGRHKVNNACMPDLKSVWMTPVVGASLGLFVLAIVVTNAYLIRERRKLHRMKQKYFRQHGGLLLFEEMRLRQGIAFKIFSEDELQNATNSFDEQQVIGRGGHGKVYKGVLKSDAEVAVKRCMIIDERQKKEFGKEMLILSQINHRNIVKLLGCCLEVEVPILVYEFIPNGTLFHLIHENHICHISLATRLQIAYESAEALAYLHSCAHPPIIHGDVKSTNILLDSEYTAKVSDFGSSILAPNDESQFVTFVQGTCGYLDPEYMQTCQLTDKSDVYSFGIVLLELLTRKKPFNLEGPEDEKSLAVRFISVSKKGRLEEILDNQIMCNENMVVVEEIAELANQCLEMSGVNRPSMKEVSERLDRLRKATQHPWAQQNPEKIESLLGESSMAKSQMVNTAHFSIEKKAFESLESGH